ncbi:MAG: hypothetical protein RSD95_05665, partial [Clostridia bacterium]
SADGDPLPLSNPPLFKSAYIPPLYTETAALARVDSGESAGGAPLCAKINALEPKKRAAHTLIAEKTPHGKGAIDDEAGI